jgi:hypothetical protein
MLPGIFVYPVLARTGFIVATQGFTRCEPAGTAPKEM